MTALRFNQPVTTPDGEGVFYGLLAGGLMLCSVRVYYPTFEQKKHDKPYYLSVRRYKAEEVQVVTDDDKEKAEDVV